MYLKNLANGDIQEINNSDVIKTLMGDKRYLLADTLEALTGENPVRVSIEEEAQEETEDQDIEDIMPRPTEPTDPEKPDYRSMTLKELRAAAKTAGIAGYSNMDKTTLAAVLEMH